MSAAQIEGVSHTPNVVRDPSRRALLKRLGLAAVGGGAAIAALKAGVPPGALGIAVPAAPLVGGGGNSTQIPSVTSDPAGAPPGSTWYRSDLGRLRVQNGILGQVDTIAGDWSSLTGRPFVTVSAVGTATGYGHNNGADFGPDTPGTTTCGIQEAMNSLASTGGVVEVVGPGNPVITSGLTLVAGVKLRSTMYWGLPYGSAGSPTTPPRYIDATAIATGDAVSCSGITTTGASMEGIAIVGNTTGNVVHFGGGQRGCALRQCFIWNKSSAAGSFGLATDTALVNDNGEDNSFWEVAAFGAYAGVGIGVNDQTQHVNNCPWYSVTTGGGSYGVYHKQGGHHLWVNWYDRSNPSVASYYIAGGNAILLGGEPQNTTSSAYCLQVAGGMMVVSGSITASGTQTTVAVSNGELYFLAGTQFNNAQTHAVTGGKVLYERTCLNAGSNVSISGTAGTVYYPTVPVSGTPTHTGFTGTFTTY